MRKKRAEWKVTLRESNYGQHQSSELVPKIVLTDTLTLDQVIARRVTEHACALNAETLRHAAALLADAVEAHLLAGCAVSTPLGTLTPAVTGVWSADRLLPEERQKNEATVRFRPSPRLKRALADPLLEDVGRGARWQLSIDSVDDVASGTRNERLTPGRAAIVRGRMLLMNGDRPERGVYLEEADTGRTVCHLTPDTFIENTRTRIVLQLPESLPEGEYRMRVVSQCTTHPAPMKQAVACTGTMRLRVGDAD